jgi:DDE superfamily endonuclease
MMYNLTSCHDTVLRQSRGWVTCLAWHRCSAQYFRRTFCGKRASRSDGRRPHINLSNATSLPCCSTRLHTWLTRWPANVWAFRAGRSGVGASAGPRAILLWPMLQDGASRPIFPPLDQAVVKAVACELVAETNQPLSRQSLADVTARAQAALGQRISRSTVWRMLATDAIKPWRYKYWIFPRDPHFAEKAGPILDLYAGTWQGKPLGPKDHILSADEKTSIQARIRCHPALPPAPGRSARVENEYERGGALQYLAAWDVRRGYVMGRCEPTTGIEPFGRLVHQVLAQEPYRSGKRLFWIVDNGSSHRGETAKQRLHQVDSRIILVHTPVHASWLNQVEIYFSIIQRKVLTPNDFANLEAIQLRLALYEELSNQRPTPFQWTFDRTALVTLLATIKAHQKLLSNAQSDCTEEAA